MVQAPFRSETRRRTHSTSPTTVAAREADDLKQAVPHVVHSPRHQRCRSKLQVVISNRDRRQRPPFLKLCNIVRMRRKADSSLGRVITMPHGRRDFVHHRIGGAERRHARAGETFFCTWWAKAEARPPPHGNRCGAVSKPDFRPYSCGWLCSHIMPARTRKAASLVRLVGCPVHSAAPFLQERWRGFHVDAGNEFGFAEGHMSGT